jgi:hypothetical protein
MADPLLPPGADQPGAPISRTMARNQLAGLSEQRMIDWMATVLETDEGSAILMTIISWGGIHQDAQLSDFDQGQRSLALKIVKLIGLTAPDAWAKELMKHAERMGRIKDEEDAWLKNALGPAGGQPRPRTM